MAIIGAILGDIAGSQYEFGRPINLDWKNCKLFTDRCYFTDDTVMTLAAKLAILNNKSFTESYREYGYVMCYRWWNCGRILSRNWIKQ